MNVMKNISVKLLQGNQLTWHFFEKHACSFNDFVLTALLQKVVGLEVQLRDCILVEVDRAEVAAKSTTIKYTCCNIMM